MSTQQPFDQHKPGSYDPYAGSPSPLTPQHLLSVNQALPYPHLNHQQIPGAEDTIINKNVVTEQVITIQRLQKKLKSSQRTNKILSIFLIISIVGNIALFGFYQSVLQNQTDTIKLLRRQVATSSQSPTDQFHHDIPAGWREVQNPLVSSESLNNIEWKDSGKNPMILGFCHYVAETYRVEAKSGTEGNTCTAVLEAPQRDIAFSVHMLLLQGDEAGITLRWSGSGQGIANYQFIVKKVGSDGSWTFRKGIPYAADQDLTDTTYKDTRNGNVYPGLFGDRGKLIIIGMKAFEDDISFYLNGNQVGRYHDLNSFGPGTIGLSTGPGSSAVMFSDAKIYMPGY